MNPTRTGTKAAAHYPIRLEPGETRTIKLRLTDSEIPAALGDPCDSEFDRIFDERRREADEFYDTVIPKDISEDARLVMRQAFAGLMWSKQFYYYDVRNWLKGDAGLPASAGRAAQGSQSRVDASL